MAARNLTTYDLDIDMGLCGASIVCCGWMLKNLSKKELTYSHRIIRQIAIVLIIQCVMSIGFINIIKYELNFGYFGIVANTATNLSLLWNVFLPDFSYRVITLPGKFNQSKYYSKVLRIAYIYFLLFEVVFLFSIYKITGDFNVMYDSQSYISFGILIYAMYWGIAFYYKQKKFVKEYFSE